MIYRFKKLSTKFGISIGVELENCWIHLPKILKETLCANEVAFKKFVNENQFLKFTGLEKGTFGDFPI